jgi:hypothetical protein
VLDGASAILSRVAVDAPAEADAEAAMTLRPCLWCGVSGIHLQRGFEMADCGLDVVRGIT